MKTLAACILIAAVASAAAAAPLAGAPPARALRPAVVAPASPALAAADPGAMRVELTGAGPASRVLAVAKGKSAMIELPVDARDVTVASPAVADVVMRTPRKISVLGVANGQTDVVFFDGVGKPILRLDVRVDIDASAVAQTIARIAPTARIRVEAVNSSLVLSGQALNAADADNAQRIAAQFVDKPDKVINLISIAGKDQVMLKVRVVEVQRNSIKQLGFNMSAVMGQVGGSQWTNAFTPTWGVNNALLGGLTGGYSRNTTQQPELEIPCSQGINGTCYGVVHGPQDASNFNTATLRDTAGSDKLNKANAIMQAFERAGLVRTLAEPNLTAVSGEPGKFLVGGEFPVPTGLDALGRVVIEFKPFGVGLGFTPIVMSDGRISLKLSTEVSELTNEGAFSLAQGSGSSASTLVIPALKVRRAETTVELPSGGALMVAGLLQDQSKQTIDSLPGLMNLPVLGALYRSRDYQNGQTELVVIITPYLVKETSPDALQTPADGLEIASDAQTILLGRLNKVYKASAPPAPGRTYQGPYGYVIE